MDGVRRINDLVNKGEEFEAIWRNPILHALVTSVLTMMGFLYLANQDGGAQVIDNYYQKAVDWDVQKAEQARSQALGWTARLDVDAGRQVRVLILDLAAPDAPPTLTRLLGQIIAREAAKVQGFIVLTSDELRTVLDREAEKQLVGCDDSSCLAEFAGAERAVNERHRHGLALGVAEGEPIAARELRRRVGTASELIDHLAFSQGDRAKRHREIKFFGCDEHLNLADADFTGKWMGAAIAALG